jgi:hypothetical protein
MPKDGYVCAVTLGPGAARPGIPWRQRTVFRKAWARWQGRVRPSMAPRNRAESSATLIWPASGSSSTRKHAGARSRPPAVTRQETWMRRRRPYVTTLADVTIDRSGESAVITYHDPAVRPVVFAAGPDIRRSSRPPASGPERRRPRGNRRRRPERGPRAPRTIGSRTRTRRGHPLPPAPPP